MNQLYCVEPFRFTLNNEQIQQWRSKRKTKQRTNHMFSIWDLSQLTSPLKANDNKLISKRTTVHKTRALRVYLTSSGAARSFLAQSAIFEQLPWPRLLEVYTELEQERFRQFLRLSQVSFLLHITQWIEFCDRSVCTTRACTNVCSSNQPVTTFDQTLDDSKFPGCSRSLVMN